MNEIRINAEGQTERLEYCDCGCPKCDGEIWRVQTFGPAKVRPMTVFEKQLLLLALDHFDRSPLFDYRATPGEEVEHAAKFLKWRVEL